MFIFIAICLSSNNLNSILCGICLSVKSSHLELPRKIIIISYLQKVFSRVIVKKPPCNFINFIKLQGGLLTITLEKYLYTGKKN